MRPLSDATLMGFLRRHKYAVVEFWAEWCQPCKTVAPKVQALSEEFKEKVAMAKINIDRHARQADRLGVCSYPTLLFFEKGRLRFRLVGTYPKNEIRAKIQELIRSS